MTRQDEDRVVREKWRPPLVRNQGAPVDGVLADGSREGGGSKGYGMDQWTVGITDVPMTPESFIGKVRGWSPIRSAAPGSRPSRPIPPSPIQRGGEGTPPPGRPSQRRRCRLSTSSRTHEAAIGAFSSDSWGVHCPRPAGPRSR